MIKFSCCFPSLACCGLLLGVLLSAPDFAAAQRVPYGERQTAPAQSVAVAYYLVDFSYTGSQDLPETFDYTDPAFGLAYTRPNLFISLAYGRGDAAQQAAERDLQFLDLALFTWGELFPLIASEAPRQRLFLPFLLHSNYRRVAEEEAGDDGFRDLFSITVLGLGSGLGYRGTLSRHVHLQARATPVFGLATRSIGNSTGTAWLVDATTELLLGPLVGRFGLTFGYSYRIQGWNVGASSTVAEDLFNYRGRMHTFRAGLSW